LVRPSESGGDAPYATISSFYGIVIEMYFADHPPPLAAKTALRLVREWLQQHRQELAENFTKLENEEAPEKIEPLP
jgi:hypothetical protein